MIQWFHHRFRLRLTADGPPRWWADILILDAVVRPVLAEHRARIRLWRVHRRADRDAIGHQFTLLAFTAEDTAEAIDRGIRRSPYLRALESQGLLAEYCLDRQAGGEPQRVEATSDRSWPVEVQRSWPYFIMGASEMILDLVEQFRPEGVPPPPAAPLAELEAYFGGLNDRLEAVWREQGSHALLHHLNALFGYGPIAARPRSVSGGLTVF